MKFHLPSFLRRVRIHGEEFDSSARAMNRVNGKGSLMSYERAFAVQADLRIVRGSTIERKQMSTKITFKRIALVAVAALGFGVLSVAPSSATVSALTVSAATAGTAGAVGAASDSTTASTFSVSALFDAGVADTVTVSFVQNGAYPAGAQVNPRLTILETTTANTSQVDNTNPQAGASFTNTFSATESISAGSGLYSISNTASAGYAGAKFGIFLESVTSLTRSAGAYNFTIIVKQFNGSGLPVTTTYPATITVAALASESLVASAVHSTLSEPSVTSKVSTVAATAAATLVVALRNASGSSGTAAKESVTATITGPGTIGIAGGAVGKSVLLAYTTDLTLSVFSDGVAGASVINVSTPSVTFPAKTITFFAKAAKTITATVDTPVLGLGANPDAISATAVDANGAVWSGAMFIVASDTASALVAGSATTPVACTWDSADLVHYCPVTAIAAGTAKFKLIDATTVALATATSNEVTVTVSSAAVASVKLAFDKATYAPNELAKITVTPVDATGKNVSAKASAAFFATGGITSTYAFSAGSDTLTATTFATSALTGAKSYTVYMPSASVDVVISATGGSALPVAGQVKVTASATVVNPSVDAATDAATDALDAANAATEAALSAADAADAATIAAQEASDAVAALSESVTKLVAALQAQIKSLAAVVAKIAKKVKA